MCRGEGGVPRPVLASARYMYLIDALDNFGVLCSFLQYISYIRTMVK